MEMENITYFDPSLPKWPALVVVGEQVTTDQAAEIIIRTGSFYFSCCSNNKAFDNALKEALGLKEDSEFDAILALHEKYGILNLEYLQNDQINSSYVAGPKGWCSWTGKIFANEFNIGKWPTASEVLREWAIIASAFPYLKLRSQLYSGEFCEDNIHPIVEYIIEDGVASMMPPTSDLVRPKDRPLNLSHLLFHSSHGVGCSIETFKKALQITLNRKETQHV